MILRSYYLYQAAANCVFFQPIFFLYYERRAGLGVATVLWLQSYNTTVRALLDFPFGAVADRTSRRGCLVAAAAAVATGAAALLVRPGLDVAIAAETLFAVASALRSGADSALLYDGLERAGRLAEYPRAEGRGQAVTALASGATAVVGGLLAAVDLRLPYVATVLAAAASAAAAAGLAEDPSRRPYRAGAWTLMRAAAGHARRTAAVRWAIGLAAFAITTSHVYFYLQQPYLEAIGLPVALFGVVFAATKVVTALTAGAAYRVDAALGARGASAAMALVPAVGLGAMAVVATPAGAGLVLTRGLLDGLWQPLCNVYQNRLVGSRLRATVLSLQSLVARLALALTLALLGAGLHLGTLAGTLLAVAAGVALLGATLVRSAPRAACRAATV
ncbi:MAG TPA: MFS transporter [Candidatus Binatia bacterium]|nr:MFS transporter [Candidatus Binatia bacterium]